MFRLLGTVAYRSRWIILTGWLVAFLLGAALAPRVFDALTGTGFDLKGTESAHALGALEEMGRTQSTIEVVFHHDALAFPGPAYLQAVQQTLAPVREVPGVMRADIPQDVTSVFVSSSHQIIVVLLWVEGNLEEPSVWCGKYARSWNRLQA